MDAGDAVARGGSLTSRPSHPSHPHAALGELDFTARVKRVLRAIPRGRVASYGQIALLAGNPRAARQVVRILHASAGKERLPWHRVLRKDGGIALPEGMGYEEQRARLLREGVDVRPNGTVDLDRFGWRPRRVLS